MNFLLWNFLEGLAAAPVSSPAADAKYPTSYLYDKLPSRPFRFGSLTTDPYVPIDLNLLYNGGFEVVSPALDGWTDASTGGASTSRTTTAGEFNTTGSSPSTAALKLSTSGASSRAERYKDVVVKLGHTLNVTAAIRGDGTRTAKVRIEILELRQYLQSAGTWTATPTDFFTRATNTYLEQKVPGIALPSLPTGRGDLARYVTVRVHAYCDTTSTGTAFVDDLYVWPSPSAAAVVGHNVANGVTCEIYKGGTAYAEGALTLVSTPTVLANTFGASFTEFNDRWMRIKFPGTNYETIWIGELAVGKLLFVQAVEEPTPSMTYASVQSRSEDGTFTYLLEDHDRRVLKIGFKGGGYTAFRTFRDSLLRASGFGADLMIVTTPTTGSAPNADQEVWICTRMQNAAEVSQHGQIYDVDTITLPELSLPTWVL